MRSHKILLLSLLFVLANSQSFSQDNGWVGSSPITLGYGIQKWKVENIYNGFDYKQVDNDPNNSGPLDIAKNNEFTYPKFQLGFENMGEHFYMNTDVSGVLDLLRDLGGYEMTGDNMDVEAARFELFSTMMSYGYWINNQIGIYAGGQYMFSRMRFSDQNVPDELFLGGHQRGLHGMLTYGLEHLLITATFKYDWVRNSKRLSKGSAQTLDIMAKYGLSTDNSFGVFAGLNIRSILSTGPSGTPTEDWKNKGIQNQGIENYSYDLPDINGNVTHFKFGIYLIP